MNKKYMDPEMSVTLFESVDVITASGDDDSFDDLYEDQQAVTKITGVN